MVSAAGSRLSKSREKEEEEEEKKRETRLNIFYIPWNRETLMPRNVFQETSSSFLSSSFRLFVPSIEASRTTKNFTKPRWNIFPPFGCVLSNEVTSFPFLSTKLIAPDRSSIFTRSGYFQCLKNKYAQPVESFPLSHFDLFEVIVKSLFDVGENNNNNNNNKRTNTGREIFSLKSLRPPFSLLWG